MRIAVVTDSNSGITQKMAAELGVLVIPTPFDIDGKTYLDDVNLSQEQFYQMLENDAEIFTAQPYPEAVMETWDKALAEYDQVVHIPLSSGLSGTCQTAMMLAGEDRYEGRVFVVNNQRVSVTQLQSVRDALLLASLGLDGARIQERLMETAMDASIFITVDTLKYLKKGGRLTPAVAMIGTLLKIKPVLSIFGDKLDSYAKARTIKQARSMMIEATRKELEERLRDPECRHTHLFIAHTNSAEAAEDFKLEVQEAFPGVEIEIAPLSLSVSCHIGPGSLALAATRKLVEEDENTPQ